MRTLAFVVLVVGVLPQNAIRGIADDLGLPRIPLAGVDSLFGGGVLPSAGLQQLLSAVGPTRTPTDWLTVAVYTLWMPLSLLTMYYVVRFRWNHYKQFAWSWFLVWYLGLIGFTFLPVEPPWMLAGIERVLSDNVTAFVDVDPNQVAAFPSLHVGIPAMLAFQARASGMPRLSRALFTFAVLTAFSVVHLGEHYVIDAIAGFAVAWVAVRLSACITRPADLVTDQQPTPFPLPVIEETPARAA